MSQLVSVKCHAELDEMISYVIANAQLVCSVIVFYELSYEDLRGVVGDN